MTMHSECDIISCHMFPQVNSELPLCSSDPWWKLASRLVFTNCYCCW